ncbi:hypothetical protein B4135_3841 [Caldibacillus debilis]|uniref:Uncharacterized protein n=1 Tax=Caldibacillus debilis TaxID=301148 RepID=A0A150L9K7_9BACI|nr:hypothetical protein B4135_3841 [Caldibacillus debilis]
MNQFQKNRQCPESLARPLPPKVKIPSGKAFPIRNAPFARGDDPILSEKNPAGLYRLMYQWFYSPDKGFSYINDVIIKN